MFTGIITAKGTIAAFERGPQFCELKITASDEVVKDIVLGASVAINGTCLTVKKVEDDTLYFDISPETEKRTTFSQVKIGDVVNIERALKYGDEVGGHMVSGHVDTVGNIKNIQRNSDGVVYEISCKEEYMKYILNKGFVAIDGVSLTVNAPTENSFFVHLIPETLARTHLAVNAIGDTVNIECDKMTQATVDTALRLMKK